MLIDRNQNHSILSQWASARRHGDRSRVPAARLHALEGDTDKVLRGNMTEVYHPSPRRTFIVRLANIQQAISKAGASTQAWQPIEPERVFEKLRQAQIMTEIGCPIAGHSERSSDSVREAWEIESWSPHGLRRGCVYHSQPASSTHACKWCIG